MSVLILHNPKAGKGRAAPIVARLDQILRRDGHALEIVEAGSTSVGHLLERASAAVIVGGDGTVHHALDEFAESGKPIAIVPQGTENLLARELGMTADPALAAAMVRAGSARAIDLGVVRSSALARRRFAIMLSVGPDASVIHRLGRKRNGAITHASYFGPTIAEAFRPALPRLVVDVDGRRLVDDQRGLLIVANCRQYALRVDPAAEADPEDGLLDVVFMPCSSTLGAVWWLLRSRFRMARRNPRFVWSRARQVRVAPGTGWPRGAALPVQLDGEAVDPGPGPIEVGVEPRSLQVFRATVGAGAIPLYSGHAGDRHRSGRDGQEALSGGDAPVRRPAG